MLSSCSVSVTMSHNIVSYFHHIFSVFNCQDMLDLPCGVSISLNCAAILRLDLNVFTTLDLTVRIPSNSAIIYYKKRGKLIQSKLIKYLKLAIEIKCSLSLGRLNKGPFGFQVNVTYSILKV